MKRAMLLASASGVLCALALLLASCQKEQPGGPVLSGQNGNGGSILAKEDGHAPQVPIALQVPAGNELAFHVFARGVQIYMCNGTFIAPEATLYNKEGEVVGKHYAGPTWESNNGSKVVGARIANSPSPDPTAIDWLLLKAALNSGHGKFAKVTYIQRLNTTGGKASAGVCVNQQMRVPYTAEYYFYRAEEKEDEGDD